MEILAYDEGEGESLGADPVDASAPDLEPTDREALTEEAETRAFLRRLRAQRNAALARDGMVAMVIGGLLGVVVAVGPSAEPPPDTTATKASDADAPAAASATQPPPPLPDHVDGPLKEEDLSRALAAQQSEIARCFALAAAPGDEQRGTVTVAFLVSEKGAVTDVADVGSTIKDRTVVHCVARSMRSLSLPAAPGGGSTVVRHAFRPPAPK